VSRLKPSHVAAVAAGNALEFYDFLTYGFFAAQIGRTFFPSTVPNASLLASLATFGAGFLMRPVGALVIGRLADRVGRKPAMLTSFGLMGLSILALAAVPSYAAIGPLAGVLVVLCRLAQGFALGGEVGPSTAYLVEVSPPHRRGLIVSFQYVGQQAAVLAAGVVGFTLAHLIPDQALDAWGWRLAFLLGLLIIPFGMILRNNLAETLDAAEGAAADPVPLSPPLTRLLALGLVLLAGGTTTTYLGNYMTTYATETLHMAKTLGFAATIAVGLFGMAGALIGGSLSDRLGRKPVMLLPWALLMVGLVPMFTAVAASRSGAALIGASAALSLTNEIAISAVLVALTEDLPKAIRSGALGLIYAFSISVFGGSTQFTVAWLTGLTHSPMAPAWYATAAVAISLAAMLMLPESAPVKVKKS
jgi:MHS family citrate/tricarballylate:H+ symporter-like MFS transporter